MPNPVFHLVCLDASLAIAPVFERFSSVVITSGTLSPLEMYPKMLGFDATVSESYVMTLSRDCFLPLVRHRAEYLACIAIEPLVKITATSASLHRSCVEAPTKSKSHQGLKYAMIRPSSEILAPYWSSIVKLYRTASSPSFLLTCTWKASCRLGWKW